MICTMPKANKKTIILNCFPRGRKRVVPGLLKSFIFLGIFLSAIIFVALFPFKMSATGNWYDNSWVYRKEIIIDHTKVSNTDQLNFPVLINLTDPDLEARARNDGRDILFTDSTGTAKIPYEREQYASSTGKLTAWVKVASLSTSTDTVLYMYYGNSGASDQEDAAGKTWDSSFKGVWHFNDRSATTTADSTANANTGIKHGETMPSETAGKIGKAQSFDGVDNYIGVAPSGTLSGSFTVSVWAKVSDDQSSHTVVGTRSGSDSSFDFKFDIGDIIHGDIGNGTDWLTTAADADPSIFTYAPETWYEITYVATSTGYSIYVNGNDVASGSYDSGLSEVPLLFDSTHSIFIGQVGYDDEWFNGAIDEVRISDIARSADWIKTEYNNQNNPSAFYSLGSEQINSRTLTYTANTNGSITGTSTQIISYGADGTAVTAAPNAGYHFVKWSDDSTANPRTDTGVTADVSVAANFAVDNATNNTSSGSGNTGGESGVASGGGSAGQFARNINISAPGANQNTQTIIPVAVPAIAPVIQNTVPTLNQNFYATTSTRKAPSVETPAIKAKNNSQTASVQTSEATAEKPALFDITSEPVQPAKQNAAPVIISAAIAGILLTTFLIFIAWKIIKLVI